ncbi:hypothetical protein HME9302_00759 [Alteripontixanthobacter maritimus]|uniref:GST-like protein n=1 Tax=Alteripontixanthobacter maritimus TaxID=2161824 RepID=A0A369Q9I3_9SPHN|nr:MAPEG family protein [Alteripontixanthobacter maritimus]RDC59569.1 hypothetical protein HME9302_00759 [Alteripontixanthobacter maritimus]
MPIITLSTTLAMASAAAIINIWLAVRIGAVRRAYKVSVGHGGNEAVERRMRAQLNFVEYTSFVLILIALIELSGRGGLWLNVVGGVYMLGRVAHGVGMDGTGPLAVGRMVGTLTSMLITLGLAIAAALIAARVI